MLQTKRIKRYDKYKDSGIEWIGKIPQHWEICKLLKLFKDRKCPNKGNVENNVLSLSYGNIKRRNTETNIGLLPESFESYNIIEPNNIVLRLTDLQNDHKSLRCGLVKERGIITSAYITLELKDSKQSANYFYRLLHTFDIEKGFYGMGAGVRQSLKFEGELCNLYIIKPPVLEQQQIADYLYKKCCEIDEVVDKQKAVIEKLKEYKQSVITETVTKGLDKSVPLKDSGIEWIGKIPQHWDSIKLKFCSYIRARLGWKGLKAEEYVEEGFPLLSAFNIVNNKLIFENLNYINQYRYDESPEIQLQINDILLVKDGAGIGKCAIIEDMPIQSTANGSLAVISTNYRLVAKFLYYYFLSKIFQEYIDRLKDGMGVPHLFQADLKEIEIVIPNELEQKEIVGLLDHKCSEIDKTIEDKEKLIEKLTEYKKSLIYECVTGKRKVVA